MAAQDWETGPERMVRIAIKCEFPLSSWHQMINGSQMTSTLVNCNWGLLTTFREVLQACVNNPKKVYCVGTIVSVDS